MEGSIDLATYYDNLAIGLNHDRLSCTPAALDNCYDFTCVAEARIEVAVRVVAR
jgi:hypothetical protein